MRLKGIWYIGDEQILLILGFYMFVSEVNKNFFSKFGKYVRSYLLYHFSNFENKILCILGTNM